MSLGVALGLSPLGNTTPGGGLMSSSLVGPPSLRQQTSMDILLQASDLHRVRATGTTPTPTPLATEFEHNPFKLPSVSSAELPAELQTDLRPGTASADAASSPKGCAETAVEADRAATADSMAATVPVVSV